MQIVARSASSLFSLGVERSETPEIDAKSDVSVGIILALG